MFEPNPKPNDSSLPPQENEEGSGIIYDSVEAIPLAANELLFNPGHTADIEAIYGPTPDSKIRQTKSHGARYTSSQTAYRNTEKPQKNSVYSAEEMVAMTTPETVSIWLSLIGSQLKSSEIVGQTSVLVYVVEQDQAEKISINATRLANSVQRLAAKTAVGTAYLESESVRTSLKAALIEERKQLRSIPPAESGVEHAANSDTPTRTNFLILRREIRAAQAAIAACVQNEVVKQYAPQLSRFLAS